VGSNPTPSAMMHNITNKNKVSDAVSPDGSSRKKLLMGAAPPCPVEPLVREFVRIARSINADPQGEIEDDRRIDSQWACAEAVRGLVPNSKIGAAFFLLISANDALVGEFRPDIWEGVHEAVRRLAERRDDERWRMNFAAYRVFAASIDDPDLAVIEESFGLAQFEEALDMEQFQAAA
jgi:hypothetical protein